MARTGCITITTQCQRRWRYGAIRLGWTRSGKKRAWGPDLARAIIRQQQRDRLLGQPEPAWWENKPELALRLFPDLPGELPERTVIRDDRD
jgi:hypothetical protein